MIKENFLKFMKEQKVPMSAASDPVKILTDESIVAKWN